MYLITLFGNFLFPAFWCLRDEAVIGCERKLKMVHSKLYTDRLRSTKGKISEVFQKHLSHLMTKPTKWHMRPAKTDQPGHPPSLISLRCALNGWLRTQAFFMRTAKNLIRLGGCPGWSESSLGAHSFYWFCHGAAHMTEIWQNHIKLQIRYPSYGLYRAMMVQ